MHLSHTYAVHSCFSCKDYSHTSKGSANWSYFYLLLAVLFAIPLCLYLTLSEIHLPWYNCLGIISIELLLFYFSGFLSGVIVTLRHPKPRACPKCKSPLLPAGNYFNNDEKQNAGDILLCILFIAANVGIWITLLATFR